MTKTLIEITLGEDKSQREESKKSFNNDSERDPIRNSFLKAIPSFNFSPTINGKIFPDYLRENVHSFDSDEIYMRDNRIVVGEFCNKGVIVPRTFSIAFSRLYNCAPLISLIRGDKDYLSFLHTWAIVDNAEVVDKQVKHWMKEIARLGEVTQTVFAPRKKASGVDTEYKTAVENIAKVSKKTIVLTRNITEIIGIVNTAGVYFRRCGYHLWGE